MLKYKISRKLGANKPKTNVCNFKKTKNKINFGNVNNTNIIKLGAPS